MTTWEVTATLDEPPAVVLGFVAHHLAMGAAHISLYFDHDPGAVISLMKGLPNVECVICDASFWADAGTRPSSHVDRQIFNANHRFQRCASDWMLHCDADEFLSDGAALRRALSQVPATTPSLRLSTVERCFVYTDQDSSIFAGAMRGPIPKLYADTLSQMYPAQFARFLHRGVAGYLGQKSLSRRGADVAIGNHHTVARDRDTVQQSDQRTPFDVAQNVQLHHFDGMTAQHAAHKLRRKTLHAAPAALANRLGPARYAQISALQAGEVTPEALFFGLRRVPPAAVDLLSRFRQLTQQSLRPDAAARALWPDLHLDFSRDGLDATLPNAPISMPQSVQIR